jgi:hypothetical protein
MSFPQPVKSGAGTASNARTYPTVAFLMQTRKLVPFKNQTDLFVTNYVRAEARTLPLSPCGRRRSAGPNLLPGSIVTNGRQKYVDADRDC